jgi:hypothetical protein
MFGRLCPVESKFVYTAFIELSTANLLKKESACYHSIKSRYMENIKAF